MVAGLIVGAAARSKSARRLRRGKRASWIRRAPASLGSVVDLGGEDLGQEAQVGGLLALGDLGQAGGFGAHDGEVQLAWWPRRWRPGRRCRSLGGHRASSRSS